MLFRSSQRFVLSVTPVDHAVAGGQAEALGLLLDHVPRAGHARALRGAVAQGSLAMTELLLAHGADATRIGTGRWVLHPELAPLLAGRGAAVDPAGSWIGASCTGNQGRKDDPDYVRALLRHGARASEPRSPVNAAVKTSSLAPAARSSDSTAERRFIRDAHSGVTKITRSNACPVTPTGR